MVQSFGITREYLASRFSESKAIIIVVPRNRDERYKQDNLSFIYIHWIDINEQCIINISHADLPADECDQLLWVMHKSPRTIYMYDPANSLNIQYTGEIVNLEFYLFFVHKYKLDVGHSANNYSLEIARQWYSAFENINDIIPMPIHMRWCKNIVSMVADRCRDDISTDQSFVNFYVKKYYQVVNELSFSGISLDAYLADLYYSVPISTEVIHPTYNVFTVTGRPSFKYDRIHLNSIERDGSQRNIIKSRFAAGQLVEYDYNSYHIHLVANIIGYKFDTTDNIHEYFGKLYFGTSNLSEEQYKQSKEITFAQMYGDSDGTYAYIDFFKQIRVYKDNLLNEFMTVGYVCTPMGRMFSKIDYPDMTGGKLFAYMQQAIETEQNILMLENIQQYLMFKNSKLIMYFYDAFLIDYSPADGRGILSDIYNILTSTGYPISMKTGLSYGDMQNTI